MERIVTVVPEDGLHARPASTFVQTASEFDATITVAPVDDADAAARADSMLAVTSLGVRGGDDVRLEADGSDAEAALDALEAVLRTPAAQLDEED